MVWYDPFDFWDWSEPPKEEKMAETKKQVEFEKLSDFISIKAAVHKDGHGVIHFNTLRDGYVIPIRFVKSLIDELEAACDAAALMESVRK